MNFFMNTYSFVELLIINLGDIPAQSKEIWSLKTSLAMQLHVLS